MSVHLSFHLSTRPSICPSIHLSIRVSVLLSLHLSIYYLFNQAPHPLYPLSFYPTPTCITNFTPQDSWLHLSQAT